MQVVLFPYFHSCFKGSNVGSFNTCLQTRSLSAHIRKYTSNLKKIFLHHEEYPFLVSLKNTIYLFIFKRLFQTNDEHILFRLNFVTSKKLDKGN